MKRITITIILLLTIAFQPMVAHALSATVNYNGMNSSGNIHLYSLKVVLAEGRAFQTKQYDQYGSVLYTRSGNTAGEHTVQAPVSCEQTGHRLELYSFNSGITQYPKDDQRYLYATYTLASGGCTTSHGGVTETKNPNYEGGGSSAPPSNPTNVTNSKQYLANQDVYKVNYSGWDGSTTNYKMIFTSASGTVYEKSYNFAPTGIQYLTCNGTYELQFFNSSGQMVSKTSPITTSSIQDPTCTSYSGDETGGGQTGGGGEEPPPPPPPDNTGSCNQCEKLKEVLACPEWEEYMGEWENLLRKVIPPPPNWHEVANIMKDAIVPAMGQEIERVMGNANYDGNTGIQEPSLPDYKSKEPLPEMKDLDNKIDFDLSEETLPKFEVVDMTEEIEIPDPLAWDNIATEAKPTPKYIGEARTVEIKEDLESKNPIPTNEGSRETKPSGSVSRDTNPSDAKSKETTPTQLGSRETTPKENDEIKKEKDLDSKETTPNNWNKE
jgi:hypothetical protein